MHRVASLLLLVASLQYATGQSLLASSDAQAIALAQQSVAALTGGATIGDVTLIGDVIQIYGPDNESGTGTFSAKGVGESRVDLNMSGKTRTDVRNVATGGSGGAWAENGEPSKAYAGHNCLTDAAWFFPAFSSLAQTGNSRYVFKYIGQEQHGKVNTQHIQIYQVAPASFPLLSKLTEMDFYLDAISHLPVAAAFNMHPDDSMGTNIHVEIGFAKYQAVTGIQVPFHFQELFNGLVVLDVTVTNVAFNSGLLDTRFTLQ